MNGTPTKKVSFVTNGDQDDDNDIDFDIDFEDDNELSVDGGGVGLEVTPEVSERAERLEKAKQKRQSAFGMSLCNSATPEFCGGFKSSVKFAVVMLWSQYY